MGEWIFMADMPEMSFKMSFNVKPNYNMTFQMDGQQIGCMEWNDGVMKFTGNAEESAKVFFEYLKQFMDDYMARTVR